MYYERLTALDASFVDIEDVNVHMHVAAALLFDPLDAEEIARALADLALDAGLRQRMERLAAQRAASFSWARTAEQTLDVYRSVALTGKGSLAGRAASVRS